MAFVALRMRSLWAGAALTAFLFGPGFVADSGSIAVTLKGHKFMPSEIHVRANTPAEIALTNADATAEEFDSSALHVEKVVAGGGKGIVRLGPLAPGRYPFMGEYHSDTAQGVVIAE
jgi:hypothetical protein